MGEGVGPREGAKEPCRLAVGSPGQAASTAQVVTGRADGGLAGLAVPMAGMAALRRMPGSDRAGGLRPFHWTDQPAPRTCLLLTSGSQAGSTHTMRVQASSPSGPSV